MNLSASLEQSETAFTPPLTVLRPSRNFRLRSILVITAIWLLTYIAGMFTPGLLDDADTVHAEAAREMVLSGDWVTLHVNGIRYMEKAPLMYWGVAASYKLFGVSEGSTRLPLMLGMLGLLLATYALGCYVYGERGGFYAALVMGTALGPYLFTRFLIPDTLVGLWLSLSFLFFLRSLDEKKPSLWTCWGLAITCALNVITKGLIGLVFPVAVIGLYLLLTGNLRHLLKLRLLSSLLVFLLVAAPWHVLAAIRNPDQGPIRGFLWFYFINEHVLRYLNKRLPRDYDTVPLALFWGLVLVWMAPWVAFLPQALKQVPTKWRQWRSHMDLRHRAALLFAIWVVVILVFFSFSTRQEYYTIPAIPALALLVGGWLVREDGDGDERVARRAGRVSSTVLFAVGGLIFTTCMFFLALSKIPAPGTDLAELLKKNPTEYALSFGHFLDLTPQAMGAFRTPLLGFGVAFLLGTGLNWHFRRKHNPRLGNVSLIAMMVGVLACVHSGFVIFSPIISSKELAVAIEKVRQPGDLIVVDGEYDAASSLNFYTGQHLLVLHIPTSNLWYGSRFADAPHVFETQMTFNPLWSGSRRVFFWTDQENPKELDGKPRYLVARSGGKAILTNFPLQTETTR